MFTCNIWCRHSREQARQKIAKILLAKKCWYSTVPMLSVDAQVWRKLCGDAPARYSPAHDAPHGCPADRTGQPPSAGHDRKIWRTFDGNSKTIPGNPPHSRNFYFLSFRCSILLCSSPFPVPMLPPRWGTCIEVLQNTTTVLIFLIDNSSSHRIVSHFHIHFLHFWLPSAESADTISLNDMISCSSRCTFLKRLDNSLEFCRI